MSISAPVWSLIEQSSPCGTSISEWRVKASHRPDDWQTLGSPDVRVWSRR